MNNPSQTNATQEDTNKQEKELKDYLKKMETLKQQAEAKKKMAENALKAKMLGKAKEHAKSTSESACEALNIADLAEKVTIEQNTENKKRLKELKEKMNECTQYAQILAYETDKLISDEERYKITFDKLSTFGAFLFKSGLLIGGWCVFMYCFFYIDYLPSGVGIGNAFAFIFIALGFGIGYVLIIGCLIGLVDLSLRILPPIFTTVKILVIVIIIESIVLFVCQNQSEKSYPIIISLILIMFSVVMINVFRGRFLLDKFHSSKARFVLVVIFVIIQFVIISPFSMLTGFDFVLFPINKLGIARQNVSMELSEKDFNLIKNTAKEADIPVLLSCNESEKTIHGVNVLWHGLGDNTFIEITSKEQEKENKTNNSQQGKQGKGKKYIRLELKSSENKIITLGNQTSAKGCIHAKLKNSFDKGKSEPSEEMTNELNDILKKVANNYDVKKLDITGYADLSPYKGGNQQLSKQRADAVKSKIDEMKNGIQEIRNLEVYSIGGGNYHADNKCNNPKLSEKDLEDCRMVDRGISLRFHVEQKKTNQGNQQDAQSKQQNN